MMPMNLYRAHVRRAVRLLLSLSLIAIVGCSGSRRDSSDNAGHAVEMRLTNTGVVPLQCRLMFGHWVDRDLGIVEPDNVVDISMMQSDRDGAFYVVREDGQRLMMIENIVCGRAGNWMASFGQVDLARLRATRSTSVTALCALPKDRERVECSTEPTAPRRRQVCRPERTRSR